jgi:hypothetical protein
MDSGKGRKHFDWITRIEGDATFWKGEIGRN